MLAKLTLLSALLALAAAKPVEMAEPTAVESDRAEVTPVPSIVPEEQARLQLSLGTAIGGALDLPPAPTAAPGDDAVNKAFAAAQLEVTVVNRHKAAITTVLVRGEGPKPRGNVGAGKLNPGQHGVFTVGHGWSGHVALNVAGK